MKSQLEISEFKNRLLQNSIGGNPNIMGTPLAVFAIFGSSDKKFYGRVHRNPFEITKYSAFYPIPYKIKGWINSNGDSTTNVEYFIKPIMFGYIWIRIIPILFVLIIISVIVSQPSLIFPLGIFGLVGILIILLNIIWLKRSVKNFEDDFIKTFEIIQTTANTR